MLSSSGGNLGRASTSLAPTSQALPRSLGSGSTAESARHRTTALIPAAGETERSGARVDFESGHARIAFRGSFSCHLGHDGLSVVGRR